MTYHYFSTVLTHYTIHNTLILVVLLSHIYVYTKIHYNFRHRRTLHAFHTHLRTETKKISSYQKTGT